MELIDDALRPVIKEILSHKDYERSFAFYRLWFDIRHTYSQIPSDPIMDEIWDATREINSENSALRGNFTQPTADLALRLASDVESDHILGLHSPKLQSRLCKRVLMEFFTDNLRAMSRGHGCESGAMRDFFSDANLIAHWANLGYVEEHAIRNHILQSLISHPGLHDYRADALYILFKVAGATFEAYADTSVVDRCFELLKDHRHSDLQKRKQIQVSALCVKEITSEFTLNSQEVIELRERNWEGLPPPPVFTTGKPELSRTNEKDPSATPVAISLGLPNRDLEPQVVQPPSLEPVITRDTDTVSGSPATHSPSISIATLSDFTTADTSDDEAPIDPAAAVPHETFYLEDGNVEVLCGDTLFRVHTSVLSFHSPSLRRMFVQTSLVSAESPNGCPRILFTDTATDFAILLKAVYLPGWVDLPLG